TIRHKWETDRQNLLNSSEEMTRMLQTGAKQKQAVSRMLDENTLKVAFQQFQSRFDSRYGGYGSAPKFPSSHINSFLLRYWKRSGESTALAMVEKTLQAMAAGGMYDQIGGGFHRYSTDAYWQIPHFEKMLYDQAILSKSYVEAYQATGHEDYGRIAREVFDYALRDMTYPDGGFYSAEDADSALDPNHPEKKSEGAFYIWSFVDIENVLGKENAEIFNVYYGVEPNGNARQDPHGEFRGRNILYAAADIEETGRRFSKKPEEIQRILQEAKEKLFQVRAKRPRPHLDDKILTDWNGLMISSLALGSRVLDEPKYRDAARKAADFILTKMKRPDGRLLHRWRKNEAAIPGFVDDYAFLVLGLADLYEATFDPRYLEEAKFLAGEMIRLFWDERDGGFFFTGADAEKLIARSKEIYDGAIPSGNSVAALALLRVGRMTMNREYEKRAESVLETFSPQLSQFPSGYPQMLMALDFILGPSREIIIASPDENQKESIPFIHEIFSRFMPNKVVLYHPPEGKNRAKIETLAPFIYKQTPLSNKPTVYVCKNYVCDLPVTEHSKLKGILKD
ncbi:MAG TPA: thioredoxin domain-containing protein, partial [bacterium]|nr:thioredoxin domain-containing protein [bacterium]